VRLPTNMCLDGVDDPRPAAYANYERQLQDLQRGIEALFVRVHPVRSTTATHMIGGVEHRHLSYACTTPRRRELSEDEQLGRLAALFLESLRRGWPTPHGYILWRQTPSLIRFEEALDPAMPLHEWEHSAKIAREDMLPEPLRPETAEFIMLRCRFSAQAPFLARPSVFCEEGGRATRFVV
jgi:hypothetical protein